jgi:hypothetical protein
MAVGLQDASLDGNEALDLNAPVIIGNPDFSSAGGTIALMISSTAVPNYFQFNCHNNNTSALTSADYVATADNGSDTTHYVDFGINGSIGSSTPFTNANAGYIYSVDNEFDIGALGTSGVVNLYAGGGISTPTQKMTMSALGGVTGVGQTGIIGFLKSANMNITTDNTIPLTLAGASKFVITSILVTNASISLTTAQGGVYSAASKGGNAIVASTQAYSALTTSTSLLSLTLASAGTNQTYAVSNLYLNLTNAQGAAATADIYVFGIPLF